jgi:signal transduction histidine kinase
LSASALPANPATSSAPVGEEVLALRAEVVRLRERLERSEAGRRQAETQLATIQRINGQVTHFMRTEELIDFLADSVRSVMQAEVATVFLADDDGAGLSTWIRTPQARRRITLAPGEGIAGWVFLHGRSVNVKDAYRDARFLPHVDQDTGFRTRSVLCQPIRDRQNRTLGVIQALNRQHLDYFSLEDEHMLGVVTSTVAMVLESNRLYLDLMDQQMELSAVQQELTSRMNSLDMLYELQKEILDAEEIDAVMEAVARRLTRSFQVRAVALTWRQGTTLVEHAWRADQADDLLVRVPRDWDSAVRDDVLADGVYRWTNQPSRAHTAVGAESTEEPVEGSTEALEIQSILVVPLTGDDQRLGAIELVNPRPQRGAHRTFNLTDAKLLSVVAKDIAVLLARSVARRRARIDDRLAAIGHMLSGVVHDLKTPLAIAQGYAQLMAATRDEQQRRAYEKQVRAQFDHIQGMMRGLLAYARGDQRLFVRPIQLSVFVEDLHRSLLQEFADSGIDVEVEALWRGEARFDEGKIQRVLFNLARNAREAMPEGGRFRVTFDTLEEGLRIRCADNGPGIDPRVRDQIFEAFVSSRKDGNSGLGLAIVAALVREHGGTVTVDSEVGEGTTFTIVLPWEPPVLDDDDPIPPAAAG